jgi:hypothetical protein
MAQIFVSPDFISVSKGRICSDSLRTGRERPDHGVPHGRIIFKNLSNGAFPAQQGNLQGNLSISPFFFLGIGR